MAAGSPLTSEKTPPSARRFRGVWAFKVFSFPVMCMFLLAGVVFAYAPRGIGIGEPDIWWRLRNGAFLLQNHSIIRVDSYSFTAAGSPWTSFEWVSDALFFLVFRSMGLQGIVTLYSITMVLIFAGVYFRSCRAGADCKDAALTTLGGICLAAVSLAPRPLLFGWLCLTGMLLVLDHFQTTKKGLWLLPPLFLVWVNLHGSWIYGMAVLGLTIVAGSVQGEWGLVAAARWTRPELKRLLMAFAGSFVALFVNPFGYKLVLYPFRFQFELQPVMQFIEYWRPVDFTTWNGKIALGLVFVLLSAALFSRKRWRLDEVLLVTFALWSALSHVRFLDFAAIIIAPILAPRLSLFQPYEPDLDKPWLNATIMAVVVAAVAFFFPSATQLQQRVNNEYPAGALAFMQREHLNGRIFHPGEFGGYLEWTAPEFKSFVDGRDEIFVANGTFQDYVSALEIRKPLEVLDKYRIDYVLLEPYRSLAYVLGRSSRWRVVYSDQAAVLFQRLPPK